MYESIPYVYELFSRYARPRDFPACQCCVSKDEKHVLLSKTLRELSADDLSNYAADVFLTVGSEADFKYFLPRILELSVEKEFLWPDPEVVLGKLKLANWSSWPEKEQAAVLSLLIKQFTSVVQAQDSDGSEIDKWICALGRCVRDVTAYLDPLLDEANESKLLSFIEWNMSAFGKGKLTNGFWQDAPENQQRILAWLNQERIKRLLNKRYGMIFSDAC
jgi:hypothetical protein